MKPLIGLSTYREQARWGVWETSADLLPTEYARAVEEVGGVPVLLPPVQPYGEAAAVVVSRLDALVISGGADVDPTSYGAEAHQMTRGTRPDRDAWEFALLDAADARGLPTLGICRGMQVMAVHGGGTLDQHVPDLVGHDQHSPGGDVYGDIRVRIAPGSALAGVIADGPTVSCHHHQSVRTHPGLVAVAWAEDGVVEAVEDPGDRFRLAVQWHPETTAERGLFRALVEAVSDRPA